MTSSTSSIIVRGVIPTILAAMVLHPASRRRPIFAVLTVRATGVPLPPDPRDLGAARVTSPLPAPACTGATRFLFVATASRLSLSTGR